MQDSWTKPYYGISHNDLGNYGATINDNGTFVHAYIIMLHPLQIRSLVEANFDTVEEAKQFCEKHLRKFNAA